MVGIRRNNGEAPESRNIVSTLIDGVEEAIKTEKGKDVALERIKLLREYIEKK